MSQHENINTVTQGDDGKPVTLRVPTELHVAVKIAAAKRGISAQDIWIEAARRYLIVLGNEEAAKKDQNGPSVRKALPDLKTTPPEDPNAE